ncbi:hypothetical protein DFH08DRAFT_813439 [Mycena albidolilacea]|uniref:Secreted protein n=1 Tax=Mycena albidolilacea TaxID=1033008 RepID=A0AAD6ZRH4_9AGAR|nr:hypothetical protein DFH08DRAFT_813439 [Mycena albidolilacea]
MRFLDHAHLVVLGLLSLGITAYAQDCTQDTDCGRNQCCLGPIGDLSFCSPLNSTQYVYSAAAAKHCWGGRHRTSGRGPGSVIDPECSEECLASSRLAVIVKGSSYVGTWPIFRCVELWTGTDGFAGLGKVVRRAGSVYEGCDSTGQRVSKCMHNCTAAPRTLRVPWACAALQAARSDSESPPPGVDGADTTEQVGNGQGVSACTFNGDLVLSRIAVIVRESESSYVA